MIVRCTYSSRHFADATIQKLAEDYLKNIESLIGHCLEQEKSGLVFTPSDFGLNGDISYKELDEFLEEDDDIMTF